MISFSLAKPRYYSDEQKLQILEKFYAMQEAYRIEKKQKMSKKLSAQFAKEMGVHINSIYNWNHRLGFKQSNYRKKFTPPPPIRSPPHKRPAPQIRPRGVLIELIR